MGRLLPAVLQPLLPSPIFQWPWVQIREATLILNVLAFTGEYGMRVGMSPVVGRY
jgi:hypothetical protein